MTHPRRPDPLAAVATPARALAPRLHLAVLWEGAAMSAESAARPRLPGRLRGRLWLFALLGPVELIGVAAVAAAFGAGLAAMAALTAAAAFVAHALLDLDAWKRSWADALSLARGGDAIHIGETLRSRLFAPAEALGRPDHPLLVPLGAGWALNLSLPSVVGRLWQGGVGRALDDVAPVADASGRRLLPIEPGTRLRIRLGKFEVLIDAPAADGAASGAGRVRRVGRGAHPEAAYIAVSAMVHVGLFVVFVVLPPEETIQVRRTRPQLLARYIDATSLQRPAAPKRPALEPTLPSRFDPLPLISNPHPSHLLAGPSHLPARAADAEAPIRATAPRRAQVPANTRSHAPSSASPKASTRPGEAVSERLVPMDLLASVTSRRLAAGPARGLDLIVTQGGPVTAGDVAPLGGAMAANMGPRTGGFAAMPFEPPGDPRRGEPEPGMATGVVQMPGLHAPRAPAVLPSVIDRLPHMVAQPPDPAPGSGLTRQLIRTHLDRQRGGLIACYKRAVQAAPSLEGKVVLAFKIAPTGAVLGAKVQSSTADSAALEACLLSKIAFFRFPPSESGAVSSVTYPLLFRVRD